MIKRFIKWLRSLSAPQPVKKDCKSIPAYHLNKHYDDMNRQEKREYRKWLAKNGLWDGAEVIDRKTKNKTLIIKP